LLMYFPLFIDLDVLPLRIWDEARLSESAYEMNKYGNYLIPHVAGYPDMWSVKPPLMIWLQVLFIKVVGTGELAVRLPAAISAFCTCLLLMAFCVKYLKNFWWGFISVIVLITSNGYMGMHEARSANYDSLLTLFITFYCIAFYAYTVSKKTKYITLTFVGIILATLTKGIAGLLFLPGLLVFAIIRKSIPGLLKSKVFYINLLLFLTIFIGYYLLREQYNPGYIQRVLADEWGGRYLGAIDGHKGGFWFYFDNLLNVRYRYWISILFVGIIVGLTIENNLAKNTVLYSTIIVLTYFLIISLCKTKIDWYDMPMYPFMALIIGGLLSILINLAENISIFPSIKSSFLQSLAVLLIIISAPYSVMTYQAYKPTEEPYNEEYFLRDIAIGQRKIDTYHVYYRGYSVQDLFYVNIINDKGGKIDITGEPDFKPGEKIIVSQWACIETLLAKYNCKQIDSAQAVKVYQIVETKSMM
jgi:4-amino-4-deoxy-L-arabinose transferase-like glycosyltransferase